ncbi:MAG: hypothetical protein H7X71_00720, partial [Chitinophagales bacterium]|nr:hypothetical protein [Chitinophagales bacterium]
GINTDWEGDIRQSYAGYTGTGTSPDIGADEGEFVALVQTCDLLPVTLFDFTGWNNGASNELHWKTASEINSDRFEVERSTDGNYFYKIGVVSAAGNSVAELDYQFFDDAPFIGMNYYRLRMVDHDDNFEYSNTILIRLGDENGFHISVFPNPAQDHLQITSTGIINDTYFISIHDMFGREMVHDMMPEENQSILTITLTGFESAPYVVIMHNRMTGEIRYVNFVKL